MTTPTLPAVVARPLDVLMIDNFDSFTWNLYQQISLLGADVTVIRNDAITPEMLPLLNIKFLIISPGPGHPKTDSGISRTAIEYFQGKVPVLGVCMGLECLVDLFGGEIGYAGEIMHGKVSSIRHDNRGCFKDIPQGIKSIRYHSLSAQHLSLPAELAITSISDSGVVMGVRHRKNTLEAVQYHPESILSEGGDELIRNFLSLRGGTWEENPHVGVLDANLPPFPVEVLPTEIASNPASAKKVPSILEKIYQQRLKDVSLAQTSPGTTLADLEKLYSLNIAPPLTSFVSRLKSFSAGRPSLIAEIKRASPSKGAISLAASPPEQALNYALAGASAISVLTEPKWFYGSLQDMLHARQSVANLPNRPAILRKDFILSRYQVLESRIWGADTILLIVSMLSEAVLRDLYAYSLELGMEPLVEVNNEKEMEVALSLPAKVIGVNNRNLHDFNVDMNTTSRLSDMVKGKDVIFCALSGISGPEDIARYASDSVDAVLVGESLMRAEDPTALIHKMLSLPEKTELAPQWRTTRPLVKICGVRTKDEALQVAAAGADMLGLMFVPKSKRCINLATAKEISSAIRASRYSSSTSSPEIDAGPWFTTHASQLSLSKSRPLLVGVFQNAPLSSVLQTVAEVQLDIVQLHGSEPFEWAQQIPVPVIRVFHVGSGRGTQGITQPGAHEFVLLDSLRSDGLSGGSGKVVDLDYAQSIVEQGEIKGSNKYPMPIILAGGLTPSNVADAVKQVLPWAVDVSGGVETEDGNAKDIQKVQAFIKAVKA